ncbi:MAG: polymorphic toxin type 50 domain-containing protein [Pararhodobacter sp.]
MRTAVSQKQNRHIEGRPEYRGGGTLSSQADAQRVLDAYHSGDAVILGRTSQGFAVVRFDGVTGTNNNVGAGIGVELVVDMEPRRSEQRQKPTPDRTRA